MDKLFNPSYADEGLEKLKDVLDRVNESPITEEVDSIAKVLQDVQIGTAPLPTLVVTLPGITKFNAFDLSMFGREIKMIRALLTAILYFSLFLYFVKYINPKFSV